MVIYALAGSTVIVRAGRVIIYPGSTVIIIINIFLFPLIYQHDIQALIRSDRASRQLCLIRCPLTVYEQFQASHGMTRVRKMEYSM